MYHIPTTDGRYERAEERGDLRRGNKRQVEQEELWYARRKFLNQEW